MSQFPNRGRHASTTTARFDRPTILLIAAIAVAVVAAGFAVTKLVGRSNLGSTTATAPTTPVVCGQVATVSVAAAPEVASAVELAAEQVPEDACVTYEITATPAREVADAIEAGQAPQVWIPDAADWTSRITEHRSGRGQFTMASLAVTPPPDAAPELTAEGWRNLGSLARTPVVLATGASPAENNSVPATATWRDMFTGTTAIQMAQPSTSAASRLALDTARGAVPATGDDYLILGQRMIFLSRFARDSDTAAFASEDEEAGDVTPFPVSEQRLANHVSGTPDSGLRRHIPAGGTPELTYPVYARADLPEDLATAVEEFVTGLQAENVQARLAEAGFRTSASPGPTINGVEPTEYEVAPVIDPERSLETTRLWETLRLDMRMLAAIDVSGSMRWAAGDSSRIDLLQKATLDALAILPDGSQIGAWIFSTARGPNREDWVPIAPMRLLSDNVDGKTHRQVLSDEIIAISDRLGGDTGLYDTALAAFLEVQKEFDERYVNSVVLITDGENDDSTDGLSLPQLLNELQAKSDPQRPVRIVTIGIGPDTDPSALQAISDATNGTSYVALHPKDIETVFFRALLARAA